jgi:DNA mismatch repair protein MutS2
VEEAPVAPAPGMRVAVGALGLEGIVAEIHGKHAEVDVRGKRLRAALRDLRVIGTGVPGRAGAAEGGPAGSASRNPAYKTSGTVRVNVHLQPREGLLSELNVIGNSADDAIGRLEKFLDELTSTDVREVRIVHGFGTGTLRRAITEYLKGHPLVERFEAASQSQGGGGATIVQLKD